jgi:hypothetical protein
MRSEPGSENGRRNVTVVVVVRTVVAVPPQRHFPFAKNSISALVKRMPRSYM